MLVAIANKVKDFLSLKSVTLLILVLAIAGRIIQLLYLFNLHSDRAQQMLATHNLISGHGITYAWVFPGDLSQIVYETVIKWPPGYSLLLAPFYVLFNHNYIIAGLSLDIIAAIVLIFVSRAILRTLNTPLYLVNVFTLLTGFYIYAFYKITSSDSIGITCFIAALYFTLLLLKNNQLWIKPTVCIIISLFVCASIKYLFLPVVFIIPLFLAIKGFADNIPQIKKSGVISFLVLGISLAALLLYQKYSSGALTYIQSTGRGFFPNNLLSSFPFIPASLINPETIGLIFPRHPSIEPIIFRMFQSVHLLFILLACMWVLLRITRNKFRKITLVESFFYLSFFISLMIAGILLILSITITKERGIWTYVQEPRYYGLPNVLIHLSVFVLYQNNRNRSSSIIKYIFYFFLLLLLIEFLRGSFFVSNRIKNFGKEQYSWQVEYELQKYADMIIKRELNKYPYETVVIAGNSPYTNYRVSLYSHIPILKNIYESTEVANLKSKKNVLLLLILREDTVQEVRLFLSIKDKQPAGRFSIFSFYTIHVSPR